MYIKSRASGFQITLFPAGSFLVFLFLTFQLTSYGQNFQSIEVIRAKAIQYQNLNLYDSALHYYSLLESQSDQEIPLEDRIQDQINICEILIQQNEVTDASERIKAIEYQLKQLTVPVPKLKAGLFQIKGAYFLGRDMDSSKYYLEKSIATRIGYSGEKDTLLYYAWNKLGLLFLKTADFEEAARCYQNALNLALQKKQSYNYQSASGYQNLAIALHQLGHYSKAERYFLKSLEINEKINNIDEPLLAYIYNNIGKFYNDLSNYDKAIDYYDKAERLLVLAEGLDFKNLLAVVYGNKGNVFTHKGDYERAILYLNKAINLFQVISQEKSDYYLRTLMDLGLVYDMKGDYQQAIKYYAESAKNTATYSVIKSFRNLGNLYYKIDVDDSALYFYRKAIQYTHFFYKEPSYDLALCYRYYGEILAKNNADSALWYYNESLEILKFLFEENNRDIARLHWLIGNYMLQKGKYDEAIGLTQRAINALMAGLNEWNLDENLTNVPRDIYLPDAFFLKARALYLKYNSFKSKADLEAGLNSVYAALQVIELIRTTYYDEETQILINNNARRSIDLGLRIAFELYKLTEDAKYLSQAFMLCEKGKAILLLSALRGLEAKSTANIPKSLLELESSINQEIAIFNNLVYNEKQKKYPDQAKISLLNDTIFSLRQSLDGLMRELQEKYTDYYKLKYDYSIFPYDSIKHIIAPDQAILEYHIADSIAYCFLITKEKFYLLDLGKSSEITNGMISLREIFTGKDFFNSNEDDFNKMRKISRELYDKLIHPFEKDIREKRLLIVPDAELGYLSFDILISNDNASGGNSYKDLSWLIKDYPISYSSSATIYFEQSLKRKKEMNAGKRLLAFAPKYEYISNVRDATLKDSLFYTLPPILGTEEEIKKISGIYKSKIFLNNLANEAAFKRFAPEYGILHLAMHTIINNQKPLYSKLVFSKTGPESEEDGYLNTYELFNLDLNGELAVLSACNTGTGKLERGEGIISLARGFFYSGIPSVVMTLWEIEDHSSADLITLFYENLNKGLSKDVAMQQAKLDYLKNSDRLHAHPYFWAGFVTIGKTDPLPKTSSLSHLTLILYIILPILLITCALFLLKRRVFFLKKRIKH